MIAVELGTLILICMGVMLTLIFGAWLISEWRRQRRERRAYYGEPLASCPRCATRNERYTQYRRL
jgi:hypothetical protein